MVVEVLCAEVSGVTVELRTIHLEGRAEPLCLHALPVYAPKPRVIIQFMHDRDRQAARTVLDAHRGDEVTTLLT